ncbi:hypothetical protein Aperf_G00000085764 [Anoplocephala perfoliata]
MNLTLSLLLLFALFLAPMNSFELHLLNTTNARTFASSVELGSSAAFATDEEKPFHEETCFHSAQNNLDVNGFSWLAVDLGSAISNLAEVYFNSNPASEFEVFVTTYMRTSAHITRDGSGLIWDSYEKCGATSSNAYNETWVTVRCAKPLKGRWLVLRQGTQKTLSICHLAVYVSEIEDTCFRMVDPSLKVLAQGNEFRLVRHISLDQCRESCMDTPTCQGLAFTRESRRRLIGKCRLFRGPDIIDPESGMRPINCRKKCRLEQNECNRGQAFQLVRQDEDEANLKRGILIWKIEDPTYLATNPHLQKILFALRFKGRIECEAESCGVIHVFLVNDKNEETVCSSIDADLISTLDGYTIKCQKSSTSSNLGSDAVAIKMIPSNTGPTAPKLDITGGHARFILVSRNRRVSSAEDLPILPDEFFAFSMQDSDRMPSAVADDEFDSPIEPLESTWRAEEIAPDSRSSSYDTAQRRPELSLTQENPSSPSKELQRYQKPSDTKSEYGNRDEDSKYLKLAEKELDTNRDSVKEFEHKTEPLTTATVFANLDEARPQRVRYASVTPSPIQHDAEAALQEKNLSPARQTPGLTALSEANALNSSDVKVAGSSSLISIIFVLAIVAAVVLAAIAAIVGFIYFRKK